MQTLMRVCGFLFGVIAGGSVGGLIGSALGDFGGRSDPENVWFLSLTGGAAVGLAGSIAHILRRSGRMGWGVSVFLGALSGIVAATAVISFVAWQRGT